MAMWLLLSAFFSILFSFAACSCVAIDNILLFLLLGTLACILDGYLPFFKSVRDYK